MKTFMILVSAAAAFGLDDIIPLLFGVVLKMITDLIHARKKVRQKPGVSFNFNIFIHEAYVNWILSLVFGVAVIWFGKDLLDKYIGYNDAIIVGIGYWSLDIFQAIRKRVKSELRIFD